MLRYCVSSYCVGGWTFSASGDMDMDGDVLYLAIMRRDEDRVHAVLDAMKREELAEELVSPRNRHGAFLLHIISQSFPYKTGAGLAAKALEKSRMNLCAGPVGPHGMNVFDLLMECYPELLVDFWSSMTEHDQDMARTVLMRCKHQPFRAAFNLEKQLRRSMRDGHLTEERFLVIMWRMLDFTWSQIVRPMTCLGGRRVSLEHDWLLRDNSIPVLMRCARGMARCSTLEYMVEVALDSALLRQYFKRFPVAAWSYAREMYSCVAMLSVAQVHKLRRGGVTGNCIVDGKSLIMHALEEGNIEFIDRVARAGDALENVTIRQLVGFLDKHNELIPNKFLRWVAMEAPRVLAVDIWERILRDGFVSVTHRSLYMLRNYAPEVLAHLSIRRRPVVDPILDLVHNYWLQLDYVTFAEQVLKAVRRGVDLTNGGAYSLQYLAPIVELDNATVFARHADPEMQAWTVSVFQRSSRFVDRDLDKWETLLETVYHAELDHVVRLHRKWYC